MGFLKIKTVSKSQHETNSPIAMTKEQYLEILSFMTDKNIEGWDFKSDTEARKNITYKDAAEISVTLAAGNKVVIE